MAANLGNPAQNLSDEEVVGRVRAGETSLYEILVHRHHKRLYGLARKVLRDDAEAEDAMQDAHMRALTHLDQYAGRSTFLTWMTRIALNESFSRLRSRPRWLATDLPASFWERNILVRVAAGQSPERTAMRNETNTMVTNALNGLPDNYRNVLVMRELDGLTTREAARRLGLTDECVKTRLHRARRLLRQRIHSPSAMYCGANAHDC